MKPNYFLIPAIALGVSLIGSSFTNGGLPWYNAFLTLPSITPPGWVIGMVWTVLYVLAAWSAIIIWNFKTADLQMGLEVQLTAAKRRAIAGFVVNAVLNMGWSFVFFTLHLIGAAVVAAAVLGLSVLWIIVNAWSVSRRAALLLFPYLAWVSFATFLNYLIFTLN